MNFKKFALLLIMAVSLGMFFYSCDETTSSEDGPIIDSIDPTTGAVGTVVTIKGSNFGTYDQATSFVYFNGEKATIKTDGSSILWEEYEIQAIVPNRATTGPVTVEVAGKTSNGITFTVPTAQPATGLMATSIDKDKIALKWTASADESSAGFQGYWLYFYPETQSKPANPVEIQKGTTKYTVTGLTEGVIYKFELHAVGTHNSQPMLSPAVTVMWSPAIRFNMNVNDDVIKLYESASDFGSGLALYDATGKAPKTLKVASGAEWDMGLYTTGGVLQFGSAKSILDEYSSFSGTAKKCEISATHYDVASLDDVYDSQALNKGHTFTEKFIDLATLNTTSNPVFVVRTNTPNWNYAKVMVLKKGGSFLQGSGSNRYIEVVVSYQSEPGIPYAF